MMRIETFVSKLLKAAVNVVDLMEVSRSHVKAMSRSKCGREVLNKRSVPTSEGTALIFR